jgi:hypothetical protein
MTLVPSSRASLRELFRNPYLVLRHDAARKLVVLNRLSLPYASIEDMRAAFTSIEEAMKHVSRPRSVLLIDSRQAPARNDPAFEEEFARLRRSYMANFRKIGILVQTAVGVLQASRFSRIDDMDVGVFTEPAEAFAYLSLDLDPARLALHD